IDTFITHGDGHGHRTHFRGSVSLALAEQRYNADDVGGKLALPRPGPQDWSLSLAGVGIIRYLLVTARELADGLAHRTCGDVSGHTHAARRALSLRHRHGLGIYGGRS